MTNFFLDAGLKSEVNGNILFEGTTYYLDIQNYNQEVLDKWFNEEYILSSIINFHPKNKVLLIRFDNIVGYVNILGNEFDVRSRKLFDNVTGNGQFKTLLDDITSISNKLTFNIKGTSFGKRKSEHEYNWNDLEVFDYYYQLVFLFPKSSNLESLLYQCMKSPNTENIQVSKVQNIENSKKIMPSFFTKLGSSSDFGKISNQHKLANTALVKRIYQKTNRKLLPTKVVNSQFSVTTNTIENKFIKFVLEEINSICLRVINLESDVDINVKAKRLQKVIHQFLIHPFFKNIQRLTFIPTSSSVLLKKAGYSEIYYHFVQSRFNFRTILENQKRLALKSGLKNIATLYEIWVFFKIATSFFGNEKINETFHGQILKNGSFIGVYTWRAKNIQLFYNKTYSKSNNGSYSVNLRPDISLLINDSELYLFDAKYKFNSNNDDNDGLIRIVKPEDIHKMHAYLDAIPTARASIVIYPGTEDIFYPKTQYVESSDLFSILQGVGAIPLLPNGNSFLENIAALSDNLKLGGSA